VGLIAYILIDATDFVVMADEMSNRSEHIAPALKKFGFSLYCPLALSTLAGDARSLSGSTFCTQILQGDTPMFMIDKVAATSAFVAFTALSVFGSAPTTADCTPTWTEDVGLPSAYLPRVRDIISFNDGSGETIYAVGLLESGPPNNRTVAVRWNGATETWDGLELQGPAGEQGSSKLLAVYDGELYAAGGYRIYDPVDEDFKSYRIVRWDPGSSDWIPVSEPIPPFGTVFAGEAMVVFDGDLYVGGFQDGNQGIGPAKLSRFDGETWSAPPAALPAATFSAFVRDLIVFDGALYASFGDVLTAGSVYKLEPGASEWVQVGDVVPSFSRMAVFQNQLYIAGTNSQFQTQVHDHVMRLVDGQWAPIPSASGGSFIFIEALTAANDGSGEALFIGGSIRHIGGVNNVHNVAKWNGENWSALGGGTLDDEEEWDEGYVTALYGWNNALWLGGEFTYVVADDDELILSRGVARWGCDAPPVDAFVSTVEVAESAISSFGGTTRVTVTPRTADGELLDPGQSVELSIDAGSLLGMVSDQGDGTYRQDLQGTTASAGTEVRATVNGVELADTPFVTFVPVEPSLSTINLSIDQTYLGGTAVITVTLLDDQGASAGSGFDVQIATTLGELTGSVIDHGDGTYSQSIIADETGTANITATVDGMALNTSAALSVLDPANLGNIIGVGDDGTPAAFLSIQAAIDAFSDGGTIFVVPGTYNETIQFDGASNLVVEGLAAFDPVIISGVVISDSSDVGLRYLTIDPEGANRPRNAVELRGGVRSNDGVEIRGSTIVNAANNGISIDSGNTNVTIVDSTVSSNGRNGIEFAGGSSGHLISGSTVSDNGWTGIEIDRDVIVAIQGNLISGNGASFSSPNPNGHGVSRARQGGDGSPEEVTLIQNTFENNNGRVQPGRSDADVRNYDQIIDETDDQPPYTD
jgi:hypothetical protein